MDKVVSNATPLIYLAKANQMSLLQSMVKQVFIPEAVYREVVIEGKRLGEKDAYRVERAIAQGWMIVQGIMKWTLIGKRIDGSCAFFLSTCKQEAI